VLFLGTQLEPTPVCNRKWCSLNNQSLIQPKQAVKSNYFGIQALRFIAAGLVLVTHSTFYASERLGTGGSVWHQGAVGVSIFFVISGFVMVVSTRKTWGQVNAWKAFILRRIIRIVPMYWTATTVKLICLLVVSSAVLHSKFDLQHIISSYFFVPTVNVEGEVKPLLAVGWTLYYEMFFYVIFAVALYTRKHIHSILCGTLLYQPA